MQSALTFLSSGFLIVVIYGCGIAVIRSAWHKRRAGFWGWIASIIVVFNAFRFTAELAGFSTYSQDELETETRKQVALINAGLPKKIDEITTLSRISFANKTYTYHYKIDENFSGKIDMKRIKGSGINNMCETWKDVLTSGELKSVEYRYLINGNTESFFVSQADCF